MQKTILFALEEVKKAGGVDGRPLEVYAEDTQTSPDAAVLAARKLIDANKVAGDPRHLVVLGLAGGPADHQCRGLPAVPRLVRPRPERAGAERQASRLPLPGRQPADRRRLCRHRRAQRRQEPCLHGLQQRRADRQHHRLPHRLGKDAAASSQARSSTSRTAPATAAELQKVLAAKPDLICRLRLSARHHHHPARGLRGREHGPDRHPRLGLGPAAGAEGARRRSARGADRVRFRARHRGRPRSRPSTPATGRRWAAPAPPTSMPRWPTTWCNVLALAHAEGRTGRGQRRRSRRPCCEIAGPPGQKVSSFAEGKAALKAGQKINYEGASGPLDFDANGDAVSVFGVNKCARRQARSGNTS